MAAVDGVVTSLIVYAGDFGREGGERRTESAKILNDVDRFYA
jgi:hypothetical protein